MNKSRFRDFIYTISGAIIIYLLSRVIFYLPCFPMLDFDTALPLCWIAAAPTCLLTLIHKERSIRNCISRTAALFLIFFAIFVFDVSIGATRFLSTSVFHMVEPEEYSMAAGLGTTFFLVPVFWFCIAINIGVIAHKVFKSVLKK